MFRSRSLMVLLITVVLVVTACSPQVAATPNATSAPVATSVPDKPVTLHLAIPDGDDVLYAPYVLEFVNQAKTLSKNNITIEPVWSAGDSTEIGYERGVVQLVKEGKLDLGLAASRAFDNDQDRITNFQALQAPFLIDNDALAVAVATSDTAKKMLDNLSSSGLTGLTLWPEDLRHPFSLVSGKPLLSPQDFAGLNIRTTPSGVSKLLVEALGGKPMFENSGYDGAESGLRQGASLTGRPTATGNVTFFAKYQVLFANGAAFVKLSDAQRAVLRAAAAAAQKKALAERPNDVAAGAAWCADGGTIVLASDEQVVAFQKAEQPVFDKLQQDSFNAEAIAAIRELKGKTRPSQGAQACASSVAISTQASTENQTWSQGLPPNGIWNVELNADDFIKMGTLKSTANNMAGVYTLTFQDGKAKIEIHGPKITVSCLMVASVVTGAVRLHGVASPDCDGNAYDDVQWRLDTDGLHFHLVSSQATDLKTMYESKPWQKVEQWSEGLPPNGAWTVELTQDDGVRMGVLKSNAAGWAGTYTWTFQDGKAKFDFQGPSGTGSCQADLALVGNVVTVTYSSGSDCKGEVDSIQWRLDPDGLHLHLVSIDGAPFVENKAYLEAKPWQKVK